ncbi:MAG: EAL domain-containing protein [Alphaproteobacteria bacterium]
MPFLFHTVIFLSYASMAVAAALMVPQTFPAVTPELAAVVGGVVLVACALVHEMVAHLEGRRELIHQLSHLSVVQGNVMDELSRARGETKGIYEALEAAGRTGKGRPDINEVIAEVRVLEKLVSQLSKDKEAAAAEAQSESGDAKQKTAPELKIATGLDEREILTHVRQGLNTGRVDLFLQPIVGLPQRKTTHYECFSRIRFGEDSILVPEQYIPLAEREGLMGAIDNMLLFRCLQLVRRCQARKRNVRFFCNISPHSLADKPFLRDFVDFMTMNTNLATNLVFELSQQAVTYIDDEVMRDLDRLAAHGFRFSLDQVTSLDMKFADLAKHRVRYLKVDANLLLSQVNGSPPALNLRKLKNELNRFGIDLIAEKIESEHTLVELLDFPIEFGQGYLFGEPRLSRDEF